MQQYDNMYDIAIIEACKIALIEACNCIVEA